MKIEDLKGWFEGEDILVCGDGPSFHAAEERLTKEYDSLNSWWTIACNRACDNIDSPMALCIENDQQAELWATMRANNPMLLFSLFPLHRRVVQIDKLDQWYPMKIHMKGMMSPWWAALVASYLGAQTVGLIGVDLVDHPGFPKDQMGTVNAYWRELDECMKVQGQRLINLNPDSALTAVEKAGWDQLRCR
jgi:hypothetical protein